jgi:signal transduction histidine kinase
LGSAEVSPGEFVDPVRESAETDQVRCVLIDSLNSFLQAMPGEQFLDLHLDELHRLPRQSEIALFRILQEAPTNVHRHSGSRAVEVCITANRSDVTLTVRDFGTRVPGDVLERFWKTGNVGVGLAGIHERLQELSGVLEIESSSQGTLLKVKIPIEECETVKSADRSLILPSSKYRSAFPAD